MVNYHENVYSRRGTIGRDHIPALPFWVAIIRVVQLIFAFLVLVLTAYASNTFGGSPGGSNVVNDLFPGYSMSFFTFAWTVLFLLYIFLTPLAFPHFYHSYAHLGLEFLTVVFWLTTFALLANECQWWSAEQSGLEDLKKAGNDLADLGYTGYTGYSNSWINKLLAASKSSRAATGLAAINWILFMVTFGFVVYFWNRHRAEHGETGFSFGRRHGNPETAHVEKTQPPTTTTELHNYEGQPQYPAATA